MDLLCGTFLVPGMSWLTNLGIRPQEMGGHPASPPAPSSSSPYRHSALHSPPMHLIPGLGQGDVAAVVP